MKFDSGHPTTALLKMGKVRDFVQPSSLIGFKALVELARVHEHCGQEGDARQIYEKLGPNTPALGGLFRITRGLIRWDDLVRTEVCSIQKNLECLGFFKSILSFAFIGRDQNTGVISSL
mmetsp:Transcript_33941/g.76714  ORF Transcript_33941/g.76714 Transcript_33941/m.76714 type:complete len:119 (-) Transcript_33941:603-959(-)